MQAITPVVRAVHIVGILPCRNLNQVMPDLSTLEAFPHAEHFHTFAHYQYKDVWTHNGWLITSIQKDGMTCQVRKGEECGRIYLEKDTAVYVHPFHRAPEDARYLGKYLDIE